MKSFSITSAIGYARILVILGVCVAVIFHKLTLLDATALATFVLGLLGSAGLMASKDDRAPETVAQVVAVQNDDNATVTIQTNIPEERNN